MRSMNIKPKLPTLILPTQQAKFISVAALDSFVYPKRLKAGQYMISDGTVQYGIVTIESKPERIVDRKNDTRMTEGYESARTLYKHDFTFIQIDSTQPNTNLSTIQFNVDSVTYPAEIYIIHRTSSDTVLSQGVS